MTEPVLRLSFVLLLSLVAGCRTFQTDQFHSAQDVDPRLPRMELGVYGPTGFFAYESFDAIELDLEENLIDPMGAETGTLVIRHRVTTIGNAAWAVLAGLTVGVANLLGAPLGSDTKEIEIQAEILDRQRTVLATYSAKGKGTAYIAAYWGYRGLDAARSATALGVRNAMDDLKEQIARDGDLLRKRLANRLLAPPRSDLLHREGPGQH